MDRNRVIELLSKKYSGEITLPEQRELFEYLKNNEDYDLVAKRIASFFEIQAKVDNEVCKDSQNLVLSNIHKNIEQGGSIKSMSRRGNFRNWRMVLSLAASLIILIGAAIFFTKKDLLQTTPQSSESVIVTKKGSKSNITLPDGTKVWMNDDTKLTYNKNFGEKTRDIFLEGEAFFDVIEDKNRPFIVHTKTIDVSVLGTEFNVRAYSNDKSTETTLLKGSIELNLKENHRKILLRPNEKIIVQNNRQRQQDTHNLAKQKPKPLIEIVNIITDPHTETIPEIEWTKNRLVFSNETMEDLILKLERWYNIKIELKKEFSQDKKFNGSFENESIDDILESLKLFENFNYTKDKEIVTLY